MPDILISLSDNCYREYLKVKQKLRINENAWSDSEILRMVLQKINSNDEFLKDLESIGKSCRLNRSKNLTDIRLPNLEQLTKCPSCDHQICMLEFTMKEAALIQLHSHFDDCHKEAGLFKCVCQCTFDWMPAYLRHVNVCADLINQSDNSHQFSPKTNNFIESQIDNSMGIENNNVISENKINLNNNNNNNPLDLSIIAKESAEFHYSNNNYSEILNQVSFPDSFQNSLSSQSNHSVSQSTVASSEINLLCQCGSVFNNHSLFKDHVNNCSVTIANRISESRRSMIDGKEITSSQMKEILKNCTINSDGKFDCPNCSKSFPSIVSVKQHFKGIHIQSESYKCDRCSKTFQWLNSYKTHMRKCKPQ